MTLRIKYALNLAAVLMILTGCIHDPACSPLVNLEVKFAIDLDMQPYVTKNHAEGAMGRYIMEIFEHGSTVPLTRYVAANQTILHGENSISAIFTLPPAKYTVAAWVDYLDEADDFYDVTDLSAIKINDNYHGSNDLDNAFVGISEIDLTPHRNQTTQVVKTIPMECPCAKIRIVAIDAEKFLIRMLAKGETKATDLSAFTVRFTYPGFLPTSFNVFENNPNDVSTGVAFTSQPVLLDDNDYLLGFDYIFVNGPESSVLLDVAVLDGNGDVVNSVSEISIPIARGKVTTIRGEFLTGSYKPGVTIDPGYAGEIEITLD